jgi:hypothetical protein
MQVIEQLARPQGSRSQRIGEHVARQVADGIGSSALPSQ